MNISLHATLFVVEDRVCRESEYNVDCFFNMLTKFVCWDV